MLLRTRTVVSRRPSGAAALLVLLYAAAVPFAATAGDLSPGEARGKEIFVSGESDAGQDIVAHVGEASVPLPANAMPCAGCHGPDGLGRPEAGVNPANITWSHLTKPYGTRSSTGRRRPAYTEENLARAITDGIDSAGNRLDPSMPRYRMAPGDMAHLVAYLKRLEYDLDPGLTDSAIRLGTLLPAGGPPDSLGWAVESVLRAYFSEINAGGGVYGRRLELTTVSAPSRSLVLARGRALIEGAEVFALVAPVTAGVDAELGEQVEANGIPVVGPFTQSPSGADTLQRYTFYLFAGLSEQAQVLLAHVSTRPGPGVSEVGVVYPRDEAAGRAAAQAVRRHAADRGWPAPLLVDYPTGRADIEAVARRLRTAGSRAVLFLGPGPDLAAFAAEGERLGWNPYLLVPGALVDKVLLDLPKTFQGRVFMAYPTAPSDQTPEGRQKFGAFLRRHELPRVHLPAQITAYAAAKVLEAGLKSAGRALSRDKLVDALEGLYRFETGLTPVLSYSANRRIGAMGAHVVVLDLEERNFRTAAGWITVE